MLDSSNELNLSTINESESSEAVESIADETILDPRFILEFSQVEADLLNNSTIDIINNSPYFATDTVFSQTQETFQLNVEEMRIYELNDEGNSADIDLNFEDSLAAILILDISIINLTDETFYYPINALKLSHLSLDARKSPSNELYPSQTGDLSKILASIDGEIGPGMTVDGYLTFSLTQQEWLEAKENKSVYLTVAPPIIEDNQLNSSTIKQLGDARTLHLPLNERTENQLAINAQSIQNRLTTEWWGNKETLIETTLKQTAQDEGVLVNLNRVDLSDFKVREEYEAYFQAFPNGQIIMTIEYDVLNQSDDILLPEDGRAYLQIAQDYLKDDEILINASKDKLLLPGETTTVIKAFALDKENYQSDWQGEIINIAIDIPSMNDEQIRETTGEYIRNDAQLNAGELPPRNLYKVEFMWEPELEKYINRNLNVVDELLESELGNSNNINQIE